MAITVFIAEDHGVVRDGLILLLKAHSDIVVAGYAENGHDAITQIKIKQPDIVLMDVSMPILNGIEATPRILACSPHSRVVMLSMHAETEYIHRALKSGAYGYLLKESAGDEVIVAIRQVVQGHRYLSQKVYTAIVDDHVVQISESKNNRTTENLTVREIEVLQWVASGRTSLEISQLMDISQKTVETYRARINEKLGIHDIPGIVKFAIKHGLTTIE